MKHAIRVGNQFNVCGLPLNEKKDFFKFPLASSKLNIYASDGKTSSELQTFKIESIVAKMICLSYIENTFVYIPHLHTLNEMK